MCGVLAGESGVDGGGGGWQTRSTTHAKLSFDFNSLDQKPGRDGHFLFPS